MNQRSIIIDLTKGLLALAMIFAHVIKLLSPPDIDLQIIAFYIDLTAFSGFFFCFGYACYQAYISKTPTPWSNILRTAFKCYLVFIISGSAYRVLLDHSFFNFSFFLQIALLRDIPPYSEFLIPFAITVIFVSAFPRLVRFSISSGTKYFIVITICCLATILPSNIDYDPVIGLFLGGEKFYYFPLVQYFPFFIGGTFIAKNGLIPRRRYLILSLIASGIFFLMMIFNTRPNRFPPSIIWIVLSGFAIYFFYYNALNISKFAPKWIIIYLNSIGQNVLYYLLMSNLILFTIKYLGIFSSLDRLKTLIIFVALMLMLFFIQYISVDFSRASRSIRET